MYPDFVLKSFPSYVNLPSSFTANLLITFSSNFFLYIDEVNTGSNSSGRSYPSTKTLSPGLKLGSGLNNSWED